MEPVETPTTPKKTRRRWRWLKFFIGLVGVLVATWIIGLAVATWDLNSAVAALRQRGQPTNYEEAVALGWARAGSQSGTDLFLQALIENERLGRPGSRALQQVPADSTFDEQQRQIYVEAAQELEPVLRLLEQAAEREPTPWTKHGDSPEESKRRFARFQRGGPVHIVWPSLKLASLGRDHEKVIKLLTLLYRLSDQYAAEPSIELAFRRFGIIEVTNDLARTLAPTLRFDEEQFQRLDGVLSKTEAELELGTALQNCRAIQAASFDDPAALKKTLQAITRVREARTWDDRAFRFLESRWIDLVTSPLGLPIRRRAAARALIVPDDVLHMVDEPRPWRPEMQKLFDGWNRALEIDVLNLTPNGDYTLGRLVNSPLAARRSLVMLRLALRLSRFVQRNGRLPDHLEEICDSSMPEIPTKWFEGAPLIYTKSGLAFRIEASTALPGGFAGPRSDLTDERYGILIKMDFGDPKSQTKGR